MLPCLKGSIAEAETGRAIALCYSRLAEDAVKCGKWPWGDSLAEAKAAALKDNSLNDGGLDSGSPDVRLQLVEAPAGDRVLPYWDRGEWRFSGRISNTTPL